MTEKNRTMAFQIPEELFQRIKRYLERESQRTGRKLTQRDFVLGLITQALDTADAEGTDTEQDTPTEAPVGPCEEPFPEEAGTEPNEEDGIPNAFRSCTTGRTRSTTDACPCRCGSFRTNGRM